MAVIFLCYPCFGQSELKELIFFDETFNDPKRTLSELQHTGSKPSQLKTFQLVKSAILSKEFTLAKEQIEHFKTIENQNTGLTSFLSGWLAIAQDKEEQAEPLLRESLQIFKTQELTALEFYNTYLLVLVELTKSYYLNKVTTEAGPWLDELNKLNAKLNDPIAQAITNMALSDYYSLELNLEQVLSFTQSALEILSVNAAGTLQAEALFSLGWVYYRLDNFYESEINFKKAAALNSKIKRYSSEGYNHLWLSYLYETLPDKEPERYASLERAIQQLSLSEDQYLLAQAYQDFGTFLMERNPQESLGHFEKAKALFHEAEQHQELAIIELEISKLHAKAGNEKEFSAAITRAISTLKSKQLWRDHLRAIRIAVDFWIERELATSIALNKEYIELVEQHGLPEDKVEGHIQSAKIAAQQGNNTSAIVFFNLAIALNENNLIREMQIREQLSKVQAALGDYKAAYDNQQGVAEFEAKKFSDEYSEKLTQMQNQIQFQAQQHQIESLEKDQAIKSVLLQKQEAELAQRNFIIQVSIIAIIPMIIIASLLYNRRLLAKQQVELQDLVEDATQEIARQHDSIAALLNNADEGFLSCSASLRVEGPFSAACHRILGVNPSNKKIHQLLFPHGVKAQAKLYKQLIALVNSENAVERSAIIEALPKELEINHRTIDIDYQMIESTRLMLVLRDVSEHKQMMKQQQQMLVLLEKATITDKLTGLNNRHKLDEVLELECERANRGDYSFCVVLLDLDHFKSVNDNFGHNTGDYVLGEVAQLLQDRQRKSDFVGRWGGEEFLVICVNTQLEDTQHFANQIRSSFESHIFEEVGNLTASFGVA